MIPDTSLSTPTTHEARKARLQALLDEISAAARVASTLTGHDMVYALASMAPLQFNGGRHTDWFSDESARDFTFVNEAAASTFSVTFDLCFSQDFHSIEEIDAFVERAFQEVFSDLG